jgi:hypothetical protein
VITPDGKSAVKGTAGEFGFVAEPKPLTSGAVVIDSGWVPGLPLPLGELLDNVLPEVELTAVQGQDCLLCIK